MQRIIGTEVEYGISSPSDPTANPILTSTQAVLAYAAAAGIQRAKRTRWDYEVESPLRDARGFDLSRSAGPPPVVDADEVGAANMILTNGARLYVDHAHPEYSGCAWSTYSRAPLVRIMFAAPTSSASTIGGGPGERLRSKPRASRSGDSTS